MKKTIITTILAAIACMGQQVPVLVPMGFWPICAAVPNAAQTYPWCTNYAPGNETYMFQASVSNPQTVAVLYAVSLTRTDGTPVTVTGVVLVSPGPSVATVGMLTFGGLIDPAQPVTITVRELAPE